MLLREDLCPYLPATGWWSPVVRALLPPLVVFSFWFVLLLLRAGVTQRNWLLSRSENGAPHLNVDIIIGRGSVSRAQAYRSRFSAFWLLTVECRIISHMRDGSAILDFGLVADGEEIQTSRTIFTSVRKRGVTPSLNKCLANPTRVEPDGFSDDAIGFLVSAPTRPAFHASHVTIVEERTKRRYQIPIPGECNLASAECLEQPS